MLFHAEYANVQHHSGSQANQAVYFALLEPGDTVLSLGLNTGCPLGHIVAAKAVAFKEMMEPEFVDYQKKVIKNIQILVNVLKEHGMKIISGGSDNCLILVDVTVIGLTGKEAQNRLDEENITVNKNTILNEQLSPCITSGIRIGSPTMTTRGYKKRNMNWWVSSLWIPY